MTPGSVNAAEVQASRGFTLRLSSLLTCSFLCCFQCDQPLGCGVRLTEASLTLIQSYYFLSSFMVTVRADGEGLHSITRGSLASRLDLQVKLEKYYQSCDCSWPETAVSSCDCTSGFPNV